MRARGRKQVWLLPVCFILAIPLAVLILKPKLNEKPDTAGSSETPSHDADIQAETTPEKKVPLAPASTNPAIDAQQSAYLPVSKPPRFSKLSATGSEVQDDSPWSCVVDREHQLIWEVKRDDGGWQDAEFTFTWHSGIDEAEEAQADATFQGIADGGDCIYISCDTASYIEQMNTAQICARANWRLPEEKELRSLDHPNNFNPDIDIQFFPHAMSGLYWSGSESAKNKALAFAVDFNNNIGYATEKRFAHYVRAVADAN